MLKLAHDAAERKKLAQEAAETASEEVIEVKKNKVVECINTLKDLLEATRTAADFLLSAHNAFRSQGSAVWNSKGDFERMQMRKK